MLIRAGSHSWALRCHSMTGLHHGKAGVAMDWYGLWMPVPCFTEHTLGYLGLMSCLSKKVFRAYSAIKVLMWEHSFFCGSQDHFF